MAGYIKLYRKFAEWEWYQDANVTRVFLHLLLSANYEDKRWRGQLIKRGQFVTSLEHLSNGLGLSIQQIRTALEKLEGTGEIAKQSTNQYTLITICKFDCYQAEGEAEQQTDNNQITNEQQTDSNQITNEQQTDNNQITTTKEYKEYKEREEDYNLSLSYTREEKFFSSMKEPNTEWQVLACMRLGLTVETLLPLIAEFELECKARMLTHVSDADIRSHFVTWAKIELEKRNRQKTNYGSRNKENIDKRGGFEPTDNTDYSA